MKNRFYTLDGWRGISILFVLAGHLLPLGPSAWHLNSSIAATGMVIFFTLSGFLITNILIKDQDITNFLIRRFMRIIPLAWLILLITFILIDAKSNLLLPHFLFYANWGSMALTPETGHFWSLCVEIQFYIFIAILVKFLKSKAFLLLPIASLVITGYRYLNSVPMAINTYYRLDEILAGCILAILFSHNNQKTNEIFRFFKPTYLLVLLIFSAHPNSSLLNYIRPYIAVLMVGSTLFNSEKKVWWNKLLKSQVLFYIGSISYALYILHGGLSHTWLGEGDTLEKYMKRPLLLVITFLLAHISTFYYEKYWIKLAKKLTTKPVKIVDLGYY
jgi:peptidoglycan/LPS O-acetylase OafA/YrhL